MPATHKSHNKSLPAYLLSQMLWGKKIAFHLPLKSICHAVVVWRWNCQRIQPLCPDVSADIHHIKGILSAVERLSMVCLCGFEDIDLNIRTFAAKKKIAHYDVTFLKYI